MKILFVCKGNVGRSQIAEALYKKIHGNNADVSSAGTQLSGPEQPICELLPKTQEVIDSMKEEGIDVSMNIRKQITEQMINDADKVVVIIEDEEVLPEYLNSPKVVRWNVVDPKGQDLEFTRKTRDQIKELIGNEGSFK